MHRIARLITCWPFQSGCHVRWRMKSASVGLVVAMTLWAGSAMASGRSNEDGYTSGIAVTLGEVVYSIDEDLSRGPVSIEVVPSYGVLWLKLDLGLLVTLESVGIASTRLGHRSFTVRPGARLTPPTIPLYVRAAFPLVIQRDNFDWGLMVGVGVDIHLLGPFNLVFEVDTAFTDDLDWGGIGLPLEFRAGLSMHSP